jgi:pimeloyl-ACP methyl ester carboxylesterase
MKHVTLLLSMVLLVLAMAESVIAAGSANEQRTTLTEVGQPGLRVERGYAPSPLGQIHYQDVGESRDGAPVYVLFHQVPWFHIYYSRAQAELAARGIRSIALDTPGYGLSARPSTPPAIGEYVAALRAALQHLGIERSVVVGHHTGATLGVEYARQAPQAVSCLIGHGVPIYTEAEAKARLAAPHWDQSYKPEGAHLSERYTFLSGRVAGSADALHWSVFSLFLAGENEWFGHHAVFKYDMASNLRQLTVPMVVMSNPGDLLDFTLERVRDVRADFGYRRLTGRSSNMAFDEAADWIDAVTQSVAAGCK